MKRKKKKFKDGTDLERVKNKEEKKVKNKNLQSRDNHIGQLEEEILFSCCFFMTY